MKDPHKVKQIGARAQEILDSDIIKFAFEALEVDLMAKWRDSDPKDELVRQEAYMMLRLMKGFRRKFKEMVIRGDDARRIMEKG